MKENLPKYVNNVIEDVAICDGEVVITLTTRMQDMDFLFDKLWSLCYIRIHRALLGAFVHRIKPVINDQADGVIGSVLQLLEEYDDTETLVQVLSKAYTVFLQDIRKLGYQSSWPCFREKLLAQQPKNPKQLTKSKEKDSKLGDLSMKRSAALLKVSSGSDGNKSDRVQKLTKKITRHASIQADLQFCDTSYDIELTTESNFVICGLITEFPLAVYIPRGTISTQDEAAMTMTITFSMTQPECNSEDDDVQHIGPTLSFTPHRYNFLRPILVFMYLPNRYHIKKKDHEYAVLYSDTDRDEEPIWEDITGFDHYPVSGVVIPRSNLAILRFTHFCSSKVVVQPSEKACVANVFAFVDHACRDVCITCLLCPERHTGQLLYEDRLANTKGSWEKSKVFSLSKNNTPVSIEVTQCHTSWKLEDEADREQDVQHCLVWKENYPNNEFFFIPVTDADSLPSMFQCRLQLKHESPLATIRVKIPIEEKDFKSEITSHAVTGMGEVSKEQRPHEPKQLTGSIKESPQKSHSEILEDKLWVLINKITLDVELWSHLRSKGVVTRAQHRKIEAEGGSADQISQILDIVIKSNTKRYYNFCEALKATNQHHIVSEYLTPTEDSTEAAFPKKALLAFLKMVLVVFKSKPFLEPYGPDDDLESVHKQLMCLLKQKEQETRT